MLQELLNLNSPIVATVATDAPPMLATGPGIGGGDVLGVGVGMFVVVAVILVLGWLYSRSRFIGGGASGAINVVATKALGPKERLMVVEVADQQLLVGMTATGVQTLHVFEKPVCIAKEAGKSIGFAGRLRIALQEVGR